MSLLFIKGDCMNNLWNLLAFDLLDYHHQRVFNSTCLQIMHQGIMSLTPIANYSLEFIHNIKYCQSQQALTIQMKTKTPSSMKQKSNIKLLKTQILPKLKEFVNMAISFYTRAGAVDFSRPSASCSAFFSFFLPRVHWGEKNQSP